MKKKLWYTCKKSVSECKSYRHFRMITYMVTYIETNTKRHNEVGMNGLRYECAPKTELERMKLRSRRSTLQRTILKQVSRWWGAR